MKYFIHVIDESFKYEKDEEGSFRKVMAKSRDGIPCESVLSDCVYCVDAESEAKSVASVLKTIKIEDEDGTERSLDWQVIRTAKKIESMSIQDEEIPIIGNENVYTDTYSNLTNMKYSIGRKDADSEWVEVHDLYIYVSPENSVIMLNG